MDNAAIHDMNGVCKILEDLGVLVYYLPPYSPDLTLLRSYLQRVKSVLKASEHTLCEDIETLLLMSSLHMVFLSLSFTL